MSKNEQWTKVEFYNCLLNVYKETGQGFSRTLIPATTDPKMVYDIIDELLADGVIRGVNSTLNEIWYCPVKGYSVEEDSYNRKWNNGNEFLPYNCIRFYLAHEKIIDLGKALQMSLTEAIQSKDFIPIYSEWLLTNWDKLQEIKTLEPLEEEVVSLGEEELDFLKTRGWYKENLSIKEGFDSIERGQSTADEELKLRGKLIKIYQESPAGVNDKEIKEQNDSINKVKNQIIMRKKIRKFLIQFDESEKIQTVVL